MIKQALKQKTFLLFLCGAVLGIFGVPLWGFIVMLCAAAVQWDEDGYL